MRAVQSFHCEAKPVAMGCSVCHDLRLGNRSAIFSCSQKAIHMRLDRRIRDRFRPRALAAPPLRATIDFVSCTRTRVLIEISQQVQCRGLHSHVRSKGWGVKGIRLVILLRLQGAGLTVHDGCCLLLQRRKAGCSRTPPLTRGRVDDVDPMV